MGETKTVSVGPCRPKWYGRLNTSLVAELRSQNSGSWCDLKLVKCQYPLMYAR